VSRSRCSPRKKGIPADDEPDVVLRSSGSFAGPGRVHLRHGRCSGATKLVVAMPAAWLMAIRPRALPFTLSLIRVTVDSEEGAGAAPEELGEAAM